MSELEDEIREMGDDELVEFMRECVDRPTILRGSHAEVVYASLELARRFERLLEVERSVRVREAADDR